MNEKKKMLVAIAACAVLLLVGVIITSSHNSDTVDDSLAEMVFPDNTDAASPLQEVVFPEAYAFDDYESKRAAWTDNPVEESFLSAVNTFSYQTAAPILSKSEGNANYSPLSFYYALALAASGARGETADELHTLLGVANRAAFLEQCGNLYRLLYKDNEISKLKIANSLWMNKKVGWKNDFLNNAAENLYAHSFGVDFSDPETGGLMAEWVSEHTNGTLTPEMKVKPEQILSILNTIYFYDEWIDRFDKAETAEDTFYRLSFDQVRCDFMNRKYGAGTFIKGKNFTRASLGLKNAGEMIFVLPDKGVSPRDLLSDPDKLREAFEGGKEGYGEIVWKIPKFSFGATFDLGDILQSLGVKAAFEEDADFSGMTDQTVLISDIRQETHIGIDEDGVEASAFTQIDYFGAGLPQEKAEMILDRPFIYGVTASNGTLLFVGICEDPSTKTSEER